MKSKGKLLSLRGAIAFFLTISVVVTVAVMIYALVEERCDNRWIALIMLCVIVVLAALCTLFDCIRRKLTVDKPVQKIMDATERIASGDFSVRLEIDRPLSRHNDYDYIMENINRMAAELAKTEVLHNDFISNVSHELKTPLAVIRSYAALLRDGNIGEEERRQYADTLVAASERLSDLVVNVLKLNKLENQEIKPEYERIKLDEMLADAVVRFEEAIEQKNIGLECELDEVSVISSPSCLEIIWNNLLSNAVKFTDCGGKISVSLKGEGNNAIVKISDTGCGISPETGKHIFEKFYQGDTSHASEGNGLGLALVKKVIDVLGGEISVESEPGKGAAFTIVLRGKI
ncbi:MAG: ATP-binding protein [Candidatus Coproplasma sp.]